MVKIEYISDIELKKFILFSLNYKMQCKELQEGRSYAIESKSMDAEYSFC